MTPIGPRNNSVHAREREEEAKKKKEKARMSGARFQAKPEGYGSSALATIIMVLFLGIVFAIPTMIVSFMLALFSIPFIIIYFYGIKKPRFKRKCKNMKFTCHYCGHIFTGYKKKCPNCKNKIRIEEYKCDNCGAKFIGKKDNCPRCNIGLYY